jgi:hypothetical protein
MPNEASPDAPSRAGKARLGDSRELWYTETYPRCILEAPMNKSSPAEREALAWLQSQARHEIAGTGHSGALWARDFAYLIESP